MRTKHHAPTLAARLARTPSGQQITDIVLETFRLHGRIIEWGDKMTKDLGLSSARWQVLGAVDVHPLTVAEIARRMGLRRQSVQRTVNSLRADGFVELEQNPNHRRAKLVQLTDKGFVSLEEAFRRQVEWVNSIAEGISPESLKETCRMMAEVRARFELR